MTHNQQKPLNSFHETNKLLNNTNTFLLDISLPLIHYLLNKNNNFETEFKEACWSNRRFASENLETTLLEATNDFIINIYIASDCADGKYSHQSAQEFHSKLAEHFQEYCLMLLQFIDEKALHEKLQSTTPELYADLRATQNKLLDATIDLTTAEASLLYWQGAIADTMLQEILLLLRYEHLGSLIR